MTSLELENEKEMRETLKKILFQPCSFSFFSLFFIFYTKGCNFFLILYFVITTIHVIQAKVFPSSWTFVEETSTWILLTLLNFSLKLFLCSYFVSLLSFAVTPEITWKYRVIFPFYKEKWFVFFVYHSRTKDRLSVFVYRFKKHSLKNSSSIKCLNEAQTKKEKKQKERNPRLTTW